MALHRRGVRTLIDELLIGAGLGLVVLGVGGRVVMRGVAMATDAPSAWSVGGTVTVLAAGAAAGAAGALLHAIARAIVSSAGGSLTARLAPFGALLALVTGRGLSGSPVAQGIAFWPLVLLYGAWFAHVLSRRARRALPADVTTAWPGRSV
jgi:hypothetical protein